MGLLLVSVVFFVVSALLVTALVLLQKGPGSGWLLGNPGKGSLLGPRTVPALFWITSIAFGLFLLLAVALNRMTG